MLMQMAYYGHTYMIVRLTNTFGQRIRSVRRGIIKKKQLNFFYLHFVFSDNPRSVGRKNITSDFQVQSKVGKWAKGGGGGDCMNSLLK